MLAPWHHRFLEECGYGPDADACLTYCQQSLTAKRKRNEQCAAIEASFWDPSSLTSCKHDVSGCVDKEVTVWRERSPNDQEFRIAHQNAGTSFPCFDFQQSWKLGKGGKAAFSVGNAPATAGGCFSK